MPLSDLPLELLQAYRYPREAPADLESFWADTLAQARSTGGEVTVTPAQTSVTAFDISDVTFPGFGGEPIRAWWTRPKGITSDLPAVVEYIGYGGGRGLPHERMLWAAHGYQHFVVDTRGQGSVFVTGDTPDPHGSGPATPGFLTKGVDAPENLYYRRVFTDAARAIDAVRTLPGVLTDGWPPGVTAKGVRWRWRPPRWSRTSPHVPPAPRSCAGSTGAPPSARRGRSWRWRHIRACTGIPVRVPSTFSPTSIARCSRHGSAAPRGSASR